MAGIVAESGAQLVARVSSQLRPVLSGLDDNLFPDGGPHSGKLVEINGESNSGKSLLLLEIIAKCILPPEHGGKESEVILINGDSTFHIFRLICVMQRLIVASNTSQSEDEVRKTIQESLERIHVHSCYNVDQFEISFLSLDHSLASNFRIGLVAVDNIAAFYSLYCKEKPIKMETLFKKHTKRLKKICSDYKVVSVFTRPIFFFGSSDLLLQEYVISLSKKDNDGAQSPIEADINMCGQNSKTSFLVNEAGVQYLDP